MTVRSVSARSWPPPPPCSPWPASPPAPTDGAGADPDRVDVVAAFYPLQFVAERVGGDAVTGHQPGQARRRAARPGAQPAARSARSPTPSWSSTSRASSRRSTRRSTRTAATGRSTWPPCSRCSTRRAGGHEHEGEAGHAEEEPAARTRTSGSTRPGWPPSRDQLAERLGAVDPDRAADYTARAADARAPSWRSSTPSTPHGLKTCQRREIVISHAAFGYLADRYELEQVAHHRAHPGGRAHPAAPGRGGRRRPGSTAPPRSSSRRWSARRSPRPSPARSARRPPCSTRSRARRRRRRATTFRSCAPTSPTLRTALGCS